MTLVLAATLDTPAASPLRLALKHMLDRREPLTIDGAAVERIGLACLQVLAAAETAAAQDDLCFRVTDASPALVEMAAFAGLATLVTA